PPPHRTFREALGTLAGDGRYLSAATAFEAYVWAAVLTSVAKGAFGRERPWRGGIAPGVLRRAASYRAGAPRRLSTSATCSPAPETRMVSFPCRTNQASGR